MERKTRNRVVLEIGGRRMVYERNREGDMDFDSSAESDGEILQLFILYFLT